MIYRLVQGKNYWVTVLIALLIAKLSLVGLIFRAPENVLLPDSYGYQDLAMNLLNTGSFSVPAEPALGLLRTPGYPALIAAIYAIVGQTPGWVIFTQSILDVLTVLLVWQIGARIFSDAVGLLGAWLLALSANVTASALYLLSDTLFTFLLMLSLFLLIRFTFESHNWLIVLSGVTMGLAMLVRPIGFYLGFLWLISLLAFKGKQNLSAIWKPALLFAAACTIVVLPWLARNHALTGRWIFSTTEATNLICCFAPPALVEDEHISIEAARDQITQPYQIANLNTIDPVNLFPAADYAALVIFQHPIGYLKAHAKGVLATLFEPTYKQWLQILGLPYQASGAFSNLMAFDLRAAALDVLGQPAGFLVAIPIENFVYSVGEFLFAIFGIYRIFNSSAAPRTLLPTVILMLTIGYLVLSPGPNGGLRFRVPAEPLLAILAASGMIYLDHQRLLRASHD